MRCLQKSLMIVFMAGLGSILFLVESIIVFPVPFMRLGLANILTLLALVWWGEKEAFILILFRIFLSAIFSGRFFGPTFFLGLGGSLSALVVMAVVYRFGKLLFGFVGVSLWGAVAKNISQLFLVGLFYIQNLNIVSLLPLFIIMTVFSGVTTGVISYWVHMRLAPVKFQLE